MKKVDYIIVGQGLAGSALAQVLMTRGLSFVIIDHPVENQASRIASGIWNPVVLKRMKKVWEADKMLGFLPSFYQQTESIFKTTIIKSQHVYRVFASTKEVDEWLLLSDSPQFEGILDTSIVKPNYPNINAPHGLGKVTKSGRIDTNAWLEGVSTYFLQYNTLREEFFDFSQLKSHTNHVTYTDLTARGIIFCEGMHSVSNNPYFKHLPFALTKGEVLTIHSSELKLDAIVNSSIFVLPLCNDLYKIGATYNWHELNDIPSEKGKNELLENAKKVINVPFTVVQHQAGIRPTIKDRRPLLGTHPAHKNVHIFNGMGSRGVLMAPWLATSFINYLEDGLPLPVEADIKRFG